MSDQEADLALIVCQLQHLITDMRAMRDDMAVIKAVLQRMDGTISDLLYEFRAMHLHQNRLANPYVTPHWLSRS